VTAAGTLTILQDVGREARSGQQFPGSHEHAHCAVDAQSTELVEGEGSQEAQAKRGSTSAYRVYMGGPAPCGITCGSQQHRQRRGNGQSAVSSRLAGLGKKRRTGCSNPRRWQRAVIRQGNGNGSCSDGRAQAPFVHHCPGETGQMRVGPRAGLTWSGCFGSQHNRVDDGG
jgi:hypothetical protein